MGLDVVMCDSLSLCGEQDPWVFYTCGKNDHCLITVDKDFVHYFTHMAAIALGKTRVFFFTSGTANMEERGKAFKKAKAKALRIIKKQEATFIASIGIDGSVKTVDRRPMPTRKQCTEAHWDSFVRVCRAEGVPIPQEAFSAPGALRLKKYLSESESEKGTTE